MEEAARPNSICHIVIPAPDLEKAKSFYETIFGWRLKANVPGETYWFFESGNISGAFDATSTPAPRSVVLVIHVKDMQATVNRIGAHGGQMLRARSRIGGASPGYDAYFLDPNGNEMGLYSDQ